MDPAATGQPAAPLSTSERKSSLAEEHRPNVNRATHPFATSSALSTGTREREHSVGAWSISSVGTGDSRGAASPSVTRSGSRRSGKGVGGSGLGRTGMPSSKRRYDKHALALRSIRAFLKERNCYDCLPVSFRLVVLDTKLIVKPALDIMWQAGIVSAPLWQSVTDVLTSESDAHASAAPGESAAPESSSSPQPPETHHGSLQSEAVDLDVQELSPSSMPSTSVSAASPSSSAAYQPPSIQARLDGHGNGSRESTLPPGKTGFAGMLTVHDIIHLIQYLYGSSNVQDAAQNVERFRLGMLRDIEHKLHVPPPPLLSIDPMRPILDACQLLMKTHARRLPLLDHDEQTGSDVVVSVLTQYRVLKFIAMNCRETAALHRTIRSLGIGTYAATSTAGITRSMTMSSTVSSSRRSSNAAYSTFSPNALPEASSGMPTDAASVADEENQRVLSPTDEQEDAQHGRRRSGAGESLHPLATVTLDTTVFDAVHVFSELGISGLPVLDEEGNAVDLFETVDVIDLVRSNANQSLDLTIRDALSRRSKDFSGVMTVSPDDSLATIFALLRSRRVHRMLILEPEPQPGNLVSESRANDTIVEEQRALQSALASDTGAVGERQTGQTGLDSSSSGQQRQRQQEQQQQPPRQTQATLLSEVPNRKRGKLVGILCLSDIMRYIIQSSGRSGQKAQRSNVPSRATSLGGAMTTATASTAASSMDPSNESSLLDRPRQGSGGSATGLMGGSHDSAQQDSLTSSDLTASHSDSTAIQSTAARFDPNDVPPTIEEHPAAEVSGTPPQSTVEGQSIVPPEEQTPTQEKTADDCI